MAINKILFSTEENQAADYIVLCQLKTVIGCFAQVL